MNLSSHVTVLASDFVSVNETSPIAVSQGLTTETSSAHNCVLKIATLFPVVALILDKTGPGRLYAR